MYIPTLGILLENTSLLLVDWECYHIFVWLSWQPVLMWLPPTLSKARTAAPSKSSSEVLTNWVRKNMEKQCVTVEDTASYKSYQKLLSSKELSGSHWSLHALGFPTSHPVITEMQERLDLNVELRKQRFFWAIKVDPARMTSFVFQHKVVKWKSFWVFLKLHWRKFPFFKDRKKFFRTFWASKYH